MKINSISEESTTARFASAVKKRLKQGGTIISLGMGEAEFEVPKEIVEATREVLATKSLGYSNPAGLPELREIIANNLTIEKGISCTKNNIIITAGAKQAYQLVVTALLQPNDEVIILNPSFVSFIPQILIAEPQCKIIEIDIDKNTFSLPISRIKKVITNKTKLLVVNSPNNPVGYIFTQKELTTLFNLAQEKNFFILSDELYDKLCFGDQEHFSIGSLEEQPTNIITINSFSKSHAMSGWRLGYACVSQELFTVMHYLSLHTSSNTCTFIQEGVIKAFDILDMGYLNQYNNKLKLRISWYMEMLERTPQISGIIPQGSFFAFLNISNLKMDSNTFCARLVEETGVATTPGIAFGKNWDDHIRVSFATDDFLVKKGLNLIETFIKSLC